MGGGEAPADADGQAAHLFFGEVDDSGPFDKTMTPIDLTSDNAGPAHPALLEAIVKAAGEGHAPYGADRWSARAQAALASVFERPVRMILTPTGAAANVLALAAACPPWGAVFCHREAHIRLDECNAPGFFTGGARLVALAGAHGRIAPDAFEKALRAWPAGVHAPTPAVLSLTHLSECGTAYDRHAIAALCERAKAAGMATHMDGARFANAVAGSGASPADVTWRAGVDMLSLGATKNGALACEALIVFDEALGADFDRLRKRGALLMSKAAFLAAQMDAWLERGLWLDLAARANAAARAFTAALSRAGIESAHPVDGNEVFLGLRPAEIAAARDRGLRFHEWPGGLARFVFDWSKTPADGERAAAILSSAMQRREAS